MEISPQAKAYLERMAASREARKHRAAEVAIALIKQIDAEDPLISIDIWRGLLRVAPGEIRKANQRGLRQVAEALHEGR